MSQYAATARTLSRAPLAGKAFSPALPTLGRAAPPYQSKWKRTEPVPLSGENFLDVLFNRTPVIKQPGFLGREECFAHEKALSHRIAPYRYYTGPLLQRVGCAQFEYQAQAAADFENRKNGLCDQTFSSIESDLTVFIDRKGRVLQGRTVSEWASSRGCRSDRSQCLGESHRNSSGTVTRI